MPTDQFDNQIKFIQQQKLIPVFNHTEADVCKKIIDLCFECGIHIFEFTNRDPKALSVFIEVSKHCSDNYPDMMLGAGTIFSLKTAEEFMDAGATFIASPAFIPSMRGVQTTNTTLWIPGCATISELAQAQEMGVKMMKIFPGELLGPAFVKAALSVMPSLKLMPTGGVQANAENLNAWFKSGVTAVGMGSTLFDKQAIELHNWIEIKSKLTFAKTIVENLPIGRQHKL
ncbi:MAG: bifunctional 4-hydroxy-2-oxoglutarate aldolase/2-dehydro-3-deoxy-phosphogluconate aldolase [Cyclobacteriaceae bacterium]|nr:bifunctional 4-hydroxy-2-oxoglutarate aldolase/2-dehydro-3-deoxy-phosphogluconate aldolase [Cyclobacteriaceae bacterium]